MTDRIIIVSKFKKAALNIEELSDRANFHEKYLPTRQAENFVGEVAAAALRGGSAHALSGAYGAGKSSLAIFTMHQLCCKTKGFIPAPLKLRDKSLQKNCSAVRNSGGMLGISVVGSSVPLAFRIIEGAKQALSDYAGTPPASLKKIAATTSRTPDNNKILSLLGHLADELKSRKKAGLLLLIDEFGRHLERMVSQQDASDMHLLQGLAELAGTRKSALSLVVVQHYGMEHYSRRLLATHRQEWEKTRGRFRETWLENTAQDVAEIAASLFSCHDKPRNKLADIKRRIKTDKIFQSVGDGFADVAAPCWPMHPATIVALTRLSAYLGQNDRTMAGWMTSDFDSGFKYAAEHSKSKDWVYPAALYRHFFGSPQNLPVNPVWARRVSEICAADERFKGDDNALMLFRTVAVLNCVGGGIANSKTLQMCLPQKFPLEEALSFLLRQSLIIYRKHRGEYCVWQGSDYDFVGALSDASEKIGKFSLAAELNRGDILPQIVAYRHLIDTGNFRTLPVEFVDPGKSPEAAKNNTPPRALVFLTDDLKKKRSFNPEELSGEQDVYGCLPASELSVLGRESSALRILLDSDPKLQEDLAAKNEIGRQLQFIERQTADAVFAALFSGIKWMYAGDSCENIQSAASRAMKEVYSEGFKLHNELINRDRSGGQMTAALRALCAAMIESANKENLGIEKHPPHLMIYKTFLQKMGMHVETKDGFHLEFDSKKVFRPLRPVVQEMEKILFKKDGTLCNIQDIVDCLSKPPYGVKQAPALILCIVCMLYHRDKLALYEDKQYAHNWGLAAIQRFLGAPDTFALAPVLPFQADDGLLKEYSHAVGGGKEDAKTVLGVARILLIQYSKLDSYGLNSDSVSEHAKKFRRAVVNAKSPSDLLFRNLPAALECREFIEKKKIRHKFFANLSGVLAELSAATTDMISRLGNIVCGHYRCASLGEARVRAARDAHAVLSKGRMYPVHKRFLLAMQCKDKNVIDDMAWVKSIAMSGLEIKKTPKPEHWSDADEASAEYALRHNLIWLTTACELLTQHKKGEFFIAVDIINGASVLKDEVDLAIKDLKNRFPESAVLEKAITHINYHLKKEDI